MPQSRIERKKAPESYVDKFARESLTFHQIFLQFHVINNHKTFQADVQTPAKLQRVTARVDFATQYDSMSFDERSELILCWALIVRFSVFIIAISVTLVLSRLSWRSCPVKDRNALLLYVTDLRKRLIHFLAKKVY